jgi:signal recognition particle receptor subunit beta
MMRQTLYDKLMKRLKEKRRFLQVLAGPRQVGKTTLVSQVIKASKLPAHYASADEPSMRDRTWVGDFGGCRYIRIDMLGQNELWNAGFICSGVRV